MKKVVAILLLLLMNLPFVADNLAFHELTYEQVADSKEADKDKKEGKKEAKEFMTGNCKKLQLSLTVANRFGAHYIAVPPNPVIAMQTPPPNRAC